jgi:hypothetical protein
VPSNVTSQIDMSASIRALKGPNKAEARAVLARGKRVEAGAKRRVQVDTGRIRTSIHSELRQISNMTVCRVGTDVSYARAIHGGTGIYGPQHIMIRPRHGKVLIWRSRSGGRIIVAREVRGQPGSKFLIRALRDV